MDRDVTQADPIDRNVAMVFQSYAPLSDDECGTQYQLWPGMCRYAQA